MTRKSLLIGTFLTVSVGHAQEIFWSYDDLQRESLIPPQCDGQFNEELGGVFVPEAKEMYDFGISLLNAEDDDAKVGAGYCLIGAATQGYIPAQAKVAQMYYKGEVLPQSNMAAYRWAYLAGLQGDLESQQLAMNLEQFLTTTEMKLATDIVPDMLEQSKKQQRKDTEYSEEALESKRQELEDINREIDEMLGINVEEIIQQTENEINQSADEELVDDVQTEKGSSARLETGVVPKGAIFTIKDRPSSSL